MDGTPTVMMLINLPGTDMWNNKTTVQKGNIGEKLVESEMEEHGFIIYKPITEGAHAFDRLCIKGKEVAIIAEVKAKAKRKYYPDTGIDYNHYLDYKRMYEKYNLDTILFFVDEEACQIYSGRLSVLDKPEPFYHKGKQLTYPIIQNSIIYFHISKMKTLCDIHVDDAGQLRKLTTKNERYK